MSVVATAQVVVTTAGARIVAPIPAGQNIVVYNRDSTNSIFVGPPGVTTTTGLEVKAGTSLAQSELEIPSETELWAMVASASVRLDILQIEGN